jgi:ABC-type polysaccharide/polyol phosphate transport system ATPase subunit
MAKIELKNINLTYPIYGHRLSLKSKILEKKVGGDISEDKNKYHVHALKNLNITFHEGDKVGLLGHNGAGKSTLLAMLSRIYPPTSGELKIDGRVQSLFNPSAGFEIEASGLKNIKRLGLLLNTDLNELEKNTEEIIKVSGLGNYINLPVRTYSEGMKLRLCFAVITSWKSDIFLIDEFLSVGDEYFYKYSQEKLNNIMINSPIVLFASHNLKFIQSLTNRVIVLKSGEIIFDGNTNDGINFYKKNY